MPQCLACSKKKNRPAPVAAVLAVAMDDAIARWEAEEQLKTALRDGDGRALKALKEGGVVVVPDPTAQMETLSNMGQLDPRLAQAHG